MLTFMRKKVTAEVALQEKEERDCPLLTSCSVVNTHEMLPRSTPCPLSDSGAWKFITFVELRVLAVPQGAAPAALKSESIAH